MEVKRNFLSWISEIQFGVDSYGYTQEQNGDEKSDTMEILFRWYVTKITKHIFAASN